MPAQRWDAEEHPFLAMATFFGGVAVFGLVVGLLQAIF